MNRFKRWAAAALILALAASVFPVLAAEPFADFRIDASEMDVLERKLSIGLYRRNESGTFSPSGAAADSVHCKVNRVTGDAMFYIQPNADGVRVTVDYLTDIDGDGLYELMDGGDRPVWDALDPVMDLVQGGNTSLVSGQTYLLSAEALSRRFEEAARTLRQNLGERSDPKSFPLCRVTLRRTDAASGQEYEQLYYLEIFEQILIPSDVSRSQWFYSAVEYSLLQGWFTGLGDGRFGPYDLLNRAQLAQVLWTAAGCPAAEPADYTDVSSGDWFCQAAAWCRQEGLMSGYEDGTFLPNTPLTREQLASVLQRYENGGPYNYSIFTDPDLYSDAGSVSPWAYDSMLWVVSHGLLPVSDNSLRPGETVTRAELAFALYTCQTRNKH